MLCLQILRADGGLLPGWVETAHVTVLSERWAASLQFQKAQQCSLPLFVVDAHDRRLPEQQQSSIVSPVCSCASEMQSSPSMLVTLRSSHHFLPTSSFIHSDQITQNETTNSPSSGSIPPALH